MKSILRARIFDGYVIRLYGCKKCKHEVPLRLKMPETMRHSRQPEQLIQHHLPLRRQHCYCISGSSASAGVVVQYVQLLCRDQNYEGRVMSA